MTMAQKHENFNPHRRSAMKALPAGLLACAAPMLAATEVYADVPTEVETLAFRWKALTARHNAAFTMTDEESDALFQEISDTQDAVMAAPPVTMRDMAIKVIVAHDEDQAMGVSERQLLAECKRIAKWRDA